MKKSKTLQGLAISAAILFAGATLPSGQAQAGSTSTTSTAIVGSALVGSALVGSELLKDGGEFIVESSTKIGEASVLVLKSAATGAKYSLKVAGNIGFSALLFAGKTVEIMVVSTGKILVAGGEVIAYIADQGEPTSFHSALHVQP